MASTDVRGYLPPDGPRNSHAVPYSWMEAAGAHRVGNVVVYSPESVILTADEDAQRTLDGYDLDEVPEDVAASALDAMADGSDEDADSLQDLAQAWGITATQSAADLRTALADVRDSGEEEASE